MKIAILGSGVYGLALSRMFLENNCKITMWTKVKEEYEMLSQKRSNVKGLPDYRLDESIDITMNMQKAMENADIIVLAVSVNYALSTIEEMKAFYHHNQCICIAGKGIDRLNLMFPSEMIKQKLNTKKIAIISGGTFAIDMAKCEPMAITLASKDNDCIQKISKCLSNKYLTVETSHDILGVEMCGAIKNVFAIASGMINKMGFTESTKSMFITKVINDTGKLISHLGGSKETLLTYAGIGDLIMTTSSLKSRNYTFGELLGSKVSIEEINNYINNNTIEGLYTLKSIYTLLKNNKYKMKIIDIMYDIIYNNADINIINNYLFND